MKKNIEDITVEFEVINSNMSINLKNLNAQERKELMKELAKQEEADRKKLEKEKKLYEAEKHSFVNKMFTKAESVYEMLLALKEELSEGMEAHSVKLNNYGKIRSNSKGGFHIENSENTLRVKRVRDTEPTWDERAIKATLLIKEFLKDTVKKRDLQTFEMLMVFLERNKQGDLELSRVMDLLQFEEKFEDERWKEGLRLLKESYKNVLKGYGFLFQKKGNDGKWESLTLNFSRI